MNKTKLISLIIVLLYTFQNLYSQSVDNGENNGNKICYSINLGYSLHLGYNKDNYSENLSEHYKDLKNGINTGFSVTYKLSDRIWLGGAYQLSNTSSKKRYEPLSYGYYGGNYGSSEYLSEYTTSDNYSTIDENIYISYLAPSFSYSILSQKKRLICIGGGIGIVRYDAKFIKDDYNSKLKGYTIGLSPQANYHLFINENLSIDFRLNIFLSYLKKFKSDSNYFGEVKHNLDFGDLYNLSRIDLSVGLNLWK